MHSRLHALRPKAITDSRLASGVGLSRLNGGKEAMEVVIDEMLLDGWLLCFDEFQV